MAANLHDYLNTVSDHDRLILEQMSKDARTIIGFIPAMMDYKLFGQNKPVMYGSEVINTAVSYAMVAAGECSSKLDGEFKLGHSEIPWAQIEKLRHMLAHPGRIGGKKGTNPSELFDAINFWGTYRHLVILEKSLSPNPPEAVQTMRKAFEYSAIIMEIGKDNGENLITSAPTPEVRDYFKGLLIKAPDSIMMNSLQYCISGMADNATKLSVLGQEYLRQKIGHDPIKSLVFWRNLYMHASFDSIERNMKDPRLLHKMLHGIAHLTEMENVDPKVLEEEYYKIILGKKSDVPEIQKAFDDTVDILTAGKGKRKYPHEQAFLVALGKVVQRTDIDYFFQVRDVLLPFVNRPREEIRMRSLPRIRTACIHPFLQQATMIMQEMLGGGQQNGR